jgi:F-type H+-transporting ATPase subunit b
LIGALLAIGLCLAHASPVAADDASAASGEGAAAASPDADPAAPETGSAEHTEDGHADPYNLADHNASEQLEDPSQWRYDLAICTLVVFLVLFALLWRFAWGPIAAGLARREKSIADRIQDAERSADAAAAQLEEYRKKMAEAAGEAQELINQARRDAEQAAEKIRQQAHDDAARERERAVADIQRARNAALRDVAQRGADLAIGLAGQIVRRELKPDEHAALISEALECFPSDN